MDDEDFNEKLERILDRSIVWAYVVLFFIVLFIGFLNV